MIENNIPPAPHTDAQSAAARYRHRTPEVEAIQWTGYNADALRAFAGADFDEIELADRIEDPEETAAVRESKHGTWRGLAPGDWVVRLDGGLYEFSAEDFAEQYEPAPADTGLEQQGLKSRAESAEATHRAVWKLCQARGERIFELQGENARLRELAAAQPAERAALRDRIRRAICEANGFDWDPDWLEPDEYGDLADAVLAVLPDHTEVRAAAYREAVGGTSGPGWYEVINPRNTTTCIALVYEDGSLYLPEGEDVLTREEFAFAAARGRAHRLARVGELRRMAAPRPDDTTGATP